MKHLVTVWLAVLMCSLAPFATAANEEQPVPILKAPFHLPVFKNDYVTLLNIYVPAGRNTGYHIHMGDAVSVNIEVADMTNQNFGTAQPGPAQRSKRGQPTYSDYRKQPRTHKASNVGTTPFHNVAFIFNSPRLSGMAPSSRAEVPEYQQIMDNERVRGWRLILEPGHAAAAITQSAPGIRIVLDGGEIVESVPGQPDRSMNPKSGEFYWQDPGVKRAIRNNSTARVEILEFELK